ncbi:MAG: hypothetical protein AB8H47_03810 [Bacteroidia bacterium]
MTKLFSILALSFLFTLVACGPQDIPLPNNPMGAQKSTNQSTLLQPHYEGDELPMRASSSQKAFEQARCQFRGTVEYVEDNEACRFLIYLEDGTVLNPINFKEIPVKIRNGMRVVLNYQEARVYESSCTLGQHARITCISELTLKKGE